MENQKWKVGNYTSTVVSDTKINNTNFPCPPNDEESPDTDIEHYGGYLVCESVGNIECANLIAAAPELLKCLHEAIELLDAENIRAREEWLSVIAKITPKNKQWKRYRFKTRSVKDYRPLIFNPKYAWWCSGEDGMGKYAIIIAYLPKDEDLLTYWDDAFDIEFTEEESITFSGRFPKPDYFVE